MVYVSSNSPRRLMLWCALLLALPAASCSDSSSSVDGSTADALHQEGGIRNDKGQTSDGQTKQLPELPQQSGVAYVAHYHTSDLRWYRLDGEAPSAGGRLDLGPGKVIHDLGLDPYHDLLFLVSDEKKEVDLYRLFRPTAKDQSLAPPERLATISLTERPLLVRSDPQRQRLYLIASPSDTETVDHYLLLAYDVSNPAQPKAVSGSPFSIPVTISVALDAPRAVLFLVEMKSKKLYGYDLSDDHLEALDGQPLDLLALYPQENQYVFQARDLTADPYRHRLYAARPQGPLSELIVLEYPAALPSNAQHYKQLAQMDQIKPLADPFEVEVAIDQRPNLLDAFAPAVDLEGGSVFLSAAAPAEAGNPALMVAITSDLKLGGGCSDYESFGCWYYGHSGGSPGGHAVTDGALCVDWTHHVVVGTTIAEGDETAPGTAQFFHYTDDLTMTPWLPASGGDLATGGLPIGAVCH
jgi:hypothetical protein